MRSPHVVAIFTLHMNIGMLSHRQTPIEGLIMESLGLRLPVRNAMPKEATLANAAIRRSEKVDKGSHEHGQAADSKLATCRKGLLVVPSGLSGMKKREGQLYMGIFGSLPR